MRFITVREALRQGAQLLDDASVPSPKLTAEVLLAHAVQQDRVWLIAHSDEQLTELGWIHYGRYLHERCKGAPTQYITGRQEFYGREFRVRPGVLIPRPETEHLVETALALDLAGKRVADIGTGSGAIACCVQLESGCRMVACDISAQALIVARENAHLLGAEIEFCQADLLDGLRAQSLDVVLSNPPYVSAAEIAGLQREVRDHEPHVALLGGELGTELYARIIEQARSVLRPEGWLVMEMGYRSLDAVQAMLADSFDEVAVIDDLAGLPRTIKARLSR